MVVVLKKIDAFRKHMAEGNDSETTGPSLTAPSLLAKLRCPQPADISRKKNVHGCTLKLIIMTRTTSTLRHPWLSLVMVSLL